MILHPALTTTGKKKIKQKFASAEAKRQFLALEEEWARNQAAWIKLSKPKASTPTKRVAAPSVKSVKSTAIPSLNSWVTGAVSSKPNPVYTGSAVLGISVLHKSNGVPVFSREDAIDISKMRR